MHPAASQGPGGPAGLATLSSSRAWMVDPSWTVACSPGCLLGGRVTLSLHSQSGSKRHCSMGCGPWWVDRARVGIGGAGSPGGRSDSGWTPGWPRPAHRWLSRGPRPCSILGRRWQGLGERQDQKTGVLGERKRGQHGKVRQTNLPTGLRCNLGHVA